MAVVRVDQPLPTQGRGSKLKDDTCMHMLSCANLSDRTPAPA